MTAPLHIVHVIESLGSGGAERVLETNLRHFPAGFRHTVITLHATDVFWAGALRSYDVAVESLSTHNSGSLWSAIRLLRCRLKALSPALVHSHLWRANLVGRLAAWSLGVPVVSSIHSPDHEPPAWADGSGIPLWKRRAIQWIDAASARLACERLIAVSEHVRQSSHKRLCFPIERIALIPNPVDITRSSEATPSDVREALGLPTECTIILSVARVSPEKGHRFVILALPAILQAHPDVHLVIVGSLANASFVSTTRALIESLDLQARVHLLGVRSDIGAVLEASSVFVFPSLYEGLGMALLEAMASGLPCVASRIPAISEYMEHDSNGLLVSPADPLALASAVSRLLSDPALAGRLGAAASAVSAQYNPVVSVRLLVRLYHSVAAGTPRRSELAHTRIERL